MDRVWCENGRGGETGGIKGYRVWICGNWEGEGRRQWRIGGEGYRGCGEVIVEEERGLQVVEVKKELRGGKSEEREGFRGCGVKKEVRGGKSGEREGFRGCGGEDRGKRR